jgi:hypothetical protein
MGHGLMGIEAGAWERGETELMRLLLQGHLDLQRVTLDVVLKDPHPAWELIGDVLGY